MGKTLLFLLLSLSMFFCSLFSGFSPAWIAEKSRNIQSIALYGAGLLIGVSIIIIIPEGIRTMYLSSFTKMKAALAGNVAS